MNKNRSGQFMATFQLLYLSILTVFDILLIIVGSIAKNPVWMVALYIVALVGLWVIYVAQLGTDRLRIYLNTIVAAMALIIYGSHTDSLTDVPLILCLLIIILSVMEDVFLLYIVSITYPALVLFHIFHTHYLNAETNWIILSRVVLGLFCVVVALFISNFFIKNRKTEDKEKDSLQNALFKAQEGNHNFLANVSHELRTPINAINGISEIMLNQELQPEIRSQVGNIHQAGHRIYDQVSGMLDYAEISMGQMVVNEREYSIAELASSCMNEIGEKNGEKGLEIITDLEDPIPALMIGDDVKIRKVLMVLLDNAYKFTSWGSIRLHVDCRKESYGTNLNLDVYDTGCGMNPDQIRRLFEGTYQGDSGSTRRTGGLGIGFALAHYMVRCMDGFVQVDSKPDKGTHVHVTIPQKPVERDNTEEVPKESENDMIRIPELRILVVDDERMNLTVMKGILKTFEVQVRAVESGSEALALCQLEDYDLIFMDHMMPEMDGEETMKRIRAMRNGFYEKVPIVALTANAASGARKMFLAMGFDEFMQKPVELSEMNRFLKKTAEGRKHE